MQIDKDFKAPRSARLSCGYTQIGNAGPLGAVLHGVLHQRIYCDPKDAEKNEKGFRSITVVSIVKEGWCYAPWKKPKGKERNPRPADAKPLMEILELEDHKGQKAIKRLKCYSFDREGKADKGPRLDDSNFEISVGMTLRFKIHAYMHELKTGRENVFPEGVDFLPEYSLVEIMVAPGTSDSAGKGFALNLVTVRPVPQSLHSYHHPLGLQLLQPTFDGAAELAVGLVTRSPPIQAQIETSNVAFFALVSPKSFITSVAPGMLRFSTPEPPVIPSVHEIDVREEDLLRLTNGGEDLGYSIFLADIAAAAGALWVLVLRDPYFQKQDPAYSEYRALPIVDTERLLEFINVTSPPGDECFETPFKIEGLEDLFAVLSVSPREVDGVPPSCQDFILHSKGVRSSRAYAITFGDTNDNDIMTLFYSPPADGAGTKRGGERERVDYRSLKTLKRSV